jgi:hypothetical protein
MPLPAHLVKKLVYQRVEHDELSMFSAGSANDDKHKHLWVKGASLFINQINNLLEHVDYNFNIVNISDFTNDYNQLGSILANNKSDKSTSHNYHIIYSYIFNQLGVDSNLNILEVGLGTNNPDIVSSMGVTGRPGASLYGFREYLPNSNIYGADIDRNILFESDRIKTCFVDQLNINTFNEINDKFGNIKYDLIIDDGLHSIGANLNTLLFALKNLNEKGWIVIEDIHIVNNWKAIDFILSNSKKYKTYVVKTKVSHIYVVNKL